jgi:hypothetical protein
MEARCGPSARVGSKAPRDEQQLQLAAQRRMPRLPHLQLAYPQLLLPLALQVQDGTWNDLVNASRVRAVRGALSEVLPGGVRLADGTVVDCEVRGGAAEQRLMPPM